VKWKLSLKFIFLFFLCCLSVTYAVMVAMCCSVTGVPRAITLAHE
jgi:hypothetical protein